MTVTAAPAYRILNSHKFADLVKSVDCSNAKNIKIQFNSGKSVLDAKNAWSWVSQATANNIIYVVDSPGCGGEHGRLPYHISGVTYDTKANVASLAVAAAPQWDDFVDDATVRIHGSDLVHNGKRASYTKHVKISLEHTYNKHFYDATIGPAHLSVDCSDCGTHGSLDADITISTKHGFTASAAAADNLSVRFAVSATASAAITTSHLSNTIEIAKIPLATFKIADVVTIQPEITLDAQISVSDIKGSLTTVFGAELAVPNGQTIAIGQGSTGFSPEFHKIGPTVSGNVDATARINPLVTLDLSGKILTKHVTGGVALAAPYLAVAIGADVNNPSVCNGGSSSIHYSVDVGAELDAFYGFGSAGDEPNKKNLWSTSKNLLKDCIAITH